MRIEKLSGPDRLIDVGEVDVEVDGEVPEVFTHSSIDLPKKTKYLDQFLTNRASLSYVRTSFTNKKLIVQKIW